MPRRSLQLDSKDSPERRPNPALVVAGTAAYVAMIAVVIRVIDWLAR